MTETKLPTYGGTDRPILPGDRFGLVGEGVDPAYEGLVESITMQRDGSWDIYDFQGNDRGPQDLRFLGRPAVGRRIEFPDEIYKMVLAVDSPHLGPATNLWHLVRDQLLEAEGS